MLRILIFGMGSYTGGGIVNYIMNQIRTFDKSKVHIDLIYHYKINRIAYEEELMSYGCAVYYLPTRKAWKEFLKEHYGEYDFIIFNTSNPIFLPLNLIKRKGGVKDIIIHSHGAAYSMPWYMMMFTPITGFYLKQKLHYLKVKKWACSEQAGLFMFKKGDEFEVIKNSIDIEAFKFNEEERNKIRKELGLKDDTIAVGMVARVDPIKNIPFGVKVFSEYHKINPNSHLYLAGGVSMQYELDKINNTVKELNIENYYTHLGNRDDISSIYSAFDVLLFPSKSEGFGMTGLEAQISGLPCLISNQVPNEIKIGDIAKFLPITEDDENYQLWAENIDKLSKIKNNRKERYKDAITAGFEIETETKRVEKILFNYLNS